MYARRTLYSRHARTPSPDSPLLIEGRAEYSSRAQDVLIRDERFRLRTAPFSQKAGHIQISIVTYAAALQGIVSGQPPSPRRPGMLTSVQIQTSARIRTSPSKDTTGASTFRHSSADRSDHAASPCQDNRRLHRPNCPSTCVTGDRSQPVRALLPHLRVGHECRACSSPPGPTWHDAHLPPGGACPPAFA